MGKSGGEAEAVRAVVDSEEEAFATYDRARRARHRMILLWIAVGCLLLGAAGYAFVRWMASQPPAG